MKKLSLLLVLALLVSMCGYTTLAESGYSQAPMFDEAVEAGELPPVEERLPENPKVTDAILEEYLDYEPGNYGGTLRSVVSTVNWDPDVFCGMNEALLTMRSQNSDVITPNIIEAYDVNDDYTVFTFTLRKGLKWSDGVEVTMEDFRFAFDGVIFNEEISPVLNTNFRSGGTSAGNPCTFEVLDDYNYRVTFDSTYGGFLVYLAVAGWTAYADYLKPAHILKQFHRDYAEECHGSLEAYYEFLQPFAGAMGYDDVTAENVWVYVFNQVDMSTWETTNPSGSLTSVAFKGLVDWNFPSLYPWVMVSAENGVTTWKRNPYYFKVDAEGQQLPYLDYITSSYVETSEMQQMSYISGAADFGLETVTAVNYSLYQENAEKANITVYTPMYHYTPTDISINVNYGLSADGSVKDDDGCRAWQEMVNDIRFRRALMYAIDAEELVDAVYNGLAEVYDRYACTHDIDTANALLDEMGALDIDGDGYRETPSGLKLEWQVWNDQRATDLIPACELYVEYWREIGLKVTVNTSDLTLVDVSTAANEIPMRVIWVHETQLWHYRDWGISFWAPLYLKWISAGGLTGNLPNDGEYLEPTEEFKAFYSKVSSLMTVSPTEAVNTVLPELADEMANDLLYLIVPITHAVNLVIINSDVGNVPNGGLGIALDFSMEQFFYRHPEEH